MNPSLDILKGPSADKWKKIGDGKRAGFLVPLFSVFSEESAGIGDINDLKHLVDWVRAAGGSILQLLPMNEMGAGNCPYDAVSSFALEPSYLHLPAAGLRQADPAIRRIKERFPFPRQKLDYRLKDAKLDVLWNAFRHNDAADAGLDAFCEKSGYWLEDFAAFKVLKYHQQGRPWYEWEDKYRDRDNRALGDFKKEHAHELLFQKWLQWQLYRQLKDAGDYAASRGVLLKGDLPVLVSRDSADVWAHPEFFKLEFAAGAPPDMYCAKGQRWGMPPYDWEKIASGQYRYLAEKLKFCVEFYDILRIDHVVGLFRIWSIPYREPLENGGLNGFFEPADENLWYRHGKTILAEMLRSSDMLLCAEDLGMIPPVCTATLAELGIPGNDVQRWTKDWSVRHDFLPAQECRRLAVGMLSTHDTTNWPAWWENEAGTVDAALFERRCRERGIDFTPVKAGLFDAARSRHGRLRWKEEVSDTSGFVSLLGRRREEVRDFAEMYENSYREKEKLWSLFGLGGAMREACDAEILQSAFKFSLESNAVFAIQSISDVLLLGGVLGGDPYQYRINTPGTTGLQNWSWVMPLALEDLMRHPVTAQLKKMSVSAKRI